MKKILFSILSLLVIITITGCVKTETIKETINQEKEIIIDYSSSTTLSKDINAKKDINGKYAKVLVVEVVEVKDDLTKFKSNNNLEFTTNEKIEISKGDYVVLNIIKNPIQEDDVWKVEFDIVKLIETEETSEENEYTIPEENTSIEKEDQVNVEIKIVMDKDSSAYVGLDKTEVEKQLKDKGFTNIETKEEKTTDSKNKSNTIKSVVVNDKEFKKDDEYKKEDKIIITYWKYEKPASEYELAFIRDLSNYDLYYMFDTDTKKVVYFGTNDTYIEKGTYTGDFSSGIIINWSHGEWTEKFVNKNGSTSAMLTDGNGFEWKFEKCEVSKAQKVLDSLK